MPMSVLSSRMASIAASAVCAAPTFKKRRHARVGLPHDGEVELHDGRQKDAVRRAVVKPVVGAQRMCERVHDAESRVGERASREHGRQGDGVGGFRVRGVVHVGSRVLADIGDRLKRQGFRPGIGAGRADRFDGVGQGVHHRARRDVGGKFGQKRRIDDGESREQRVVGQYRFDHQLLVRDDGTHGDLAARACRSGNGDERRAGFRGLSASVIVARHASVRDDGEGRLGGVHRAAAARGDEAVAPVLVEEIAGRDDAGVRGVRLGLIVELIVERPIFESLDDRVERPARCESRIGDEHRFRHPQALCFFSDVGDLSATEANAGAGCDFKRFHHEYTPSLLV